MRAHTRSHTHVAYARARARVRDFPFSFIKAISYHTGHILFLQNRTVTISYFGTRLLVWRRFFDKHVLIYMRAYVSNTRTNPLIRIRPVHLRCVTYLFLFLVFFLSLSAFAILPRNIVIGMPDSS